MSTYDQGTGWIILPSDSDITHHGVEGQKHGVRNGPPYPLGVSKAEYKKMQKANKKELKAVKASARREKKLEKQKEKIQRQKNKAVSQNSYKKLYAMKDKLGYKDLQNAMDRIDLEERLTFKAYPPKKTFSYHLGKLFDSLSKVNGWYKTGLNAYKNLMELPSELNKLNKKRNQNNNNGNNYKNNNNGGNSYNKKDKKTNWYRSSNSSKYFNNYQKIDYNKLHTNTTSAYGNGKNKKLKRSYYKNTVIF